MKKESYSTDKIKWPRTAGEALDIQSKLKAERNFRSLEKVPEYVCGLDVDYSKDESCVKAACVVMSYPAMDEVEGIAEVYYPDFVFSYTPGLLAFRELPFIIPLIKKLKTAVDVFVVNGHGMLHKRGMGMAVHLGIIMKKPTVGCARNPLFGDEKEVVNIRGGYSLITSAQEGIVGALVRTRKSARPVYVSQGWGVGLLEAVDIIVNCSGRYRMPEVLRLAHMKSKIC
jgi:deoxyribonuclease V